MKTKIFLITLCLFIVSDFFISNIFGENILNPTIAFEKKYRVDHEIYHHGLRPNYNGDALSWPPPKTYHLCTDGNGFKSACGATTIKEFDIAFIGDSFTEGYGVSYEDSFVGRFANAHPHLKIANFGVATYAPSIYRAKIETLLKDGYKFKRLFVFSDKNDIHDEATRYITNDQGNIISNPSYRKVSKIRKFFKYNFILTYHIYVFPNRLFKMLKKGNVEQNNKLKVIFAPPNGEWTYKPDSTSFGSMGIDGGINKALSEMKKIYEILQEYGVKMSVGVYPHIGDINRKDLEKNRHVELWSNFCKNKCEFFFNAYSNFSDIAQNMTTMDVYKKYYLYMDGHYNAEGHKVVFTSIDNTFKIPN